MATDNKHVGSPDYWQNQYYELLAELENRQKDWSESEHALCQIVTQLTQIVDSGQTLPADSIPGLQTALQDTQNVTQLKNMADLLQQQMTDKDTDQPVSVNDKSALQLLGSLQVPDEVSGDIKQLLDKIKQVEKGSLNEDVLNGFARVILHLVEKSPDSSGRKQKLLERILLHKSPKSDTPEENRTINENTTPSPEQESQQRLIAPAVGELLLQLALRLPDEVKRRVNFNAIKKHCNRARRRKDLIKIIDVIAQNIKMSYLQDEPLVVDLQNESVSAVAEVIRDFFQQLDPPQDMVEKVNQLEEYFYDKSNDINGLLHCLNSLVEITVQISRRLGSQQGKMMNFISGQNLILHEIDSSINDSLKGFTHDRQEINEKLRIIQNEIENIKVLTTKLVKDDQSITKLLPGLNNTNSQLTLLQGSLDESLNKPEVFFADFSTRTGKLKENSHGMMTELFEYAGQQLNDTLTNIPGRVACEEQLSQEIARCKRYSKSLSIQLWNIDKLQIVNDAYGRASGDYVLRIIARLLRDNLRETDYVARYGGDTFVTLMPETELDSALPVANKLRGLVEQMPFHFRDSRVRLTISVGVAQFNTSEMSGELLARANAALLSAKRSGRNKVAASK